MGLSDHTMGVGVAVASTALGASVVEKHFTFSRTDGGVGSAFSLEPHELKSLVVESVRALQALGNVSYGPTKAEQKSLGLINIYNNQKYLIENFQGTFRGGVCGNLSQLCLLTLAIYY